ncbi:aromatic ring-hydroxylating dioxygenase subunit alpha [Parathalassolituus penaei]|uniref:Aromatic ring-hydroxylating dioxygenase subunit alpha n=1 Tax=Parathalassolituus penaei TaxID=2997323 RepID=A0A9X3EBT7_9GAMM|nr:aromatic ring-hydroxylating dioxygenase subunit alpha [Parathalassolituus penaei]MCY0964698.1 aromatic ring-hydroxylating dioxygenase subunit alpha [Parathalassolituus penaei]
MTTTQPASNLNSSNLDSPYLYNCWYVAALATEVDNEALFSRTLLETSVLIYRRADGTPVAMQDRCPHRFVPLSMGKRDGDDVVCPYHGLKFDCSGKCNHNPHGNQLIPKAAQVRSFPLVERYGFLWIWLGDREQANPDLIPNYGPLVDGHPNAVGYTYMPRDCHYEVIIDNVMDLSHVDHLHGEIISTRGQLTPKPPVVEEDASSVTAHWRWEQTPAMLIFNQFLPAPQDSARHFIDITWRAPASVQLSVGATQNPEYTDLNLRNCTGQYDLHTCTPENQNRTHYFFATRRNHLEDDAEFNAMKIKAMHDAFVDEDGPIMDAAHREMGTSDLFSLNPVLLPSDVAPVKVRRKLAEMRRNEQPSGSAVNNR